jgi:hypothetical protein
MGSRSQKKFIYLQSWQAQKGKFSIVFFFFFF